MRTLHVNHIKIPLRDERAAVLLRAGVLYECGDSHDLHIDPAKPIYLTSIEILSVAIAEGVTDSLADISVDTATAILTHLQPDGTTLITTNDVARAVPVDEPVFLLRAQDRFAADTVKFWAQLAADNGADEDIVEEAFRHSEKMETWPVKKMPDLPGETISSEDVERLGGELAKKYLEKIESPEVKGLPVAGYKPTQSQASIDLVNEGKQIEERALRWAERVDMDTYGFRIGGMRDIQVGFMQVYRAAFQPEGSRIALPEDAPSGAPRDWRDTTTGS